MTQVDRAIAGRSERRRPARSPVAKSRPGTRRPENGLSAAGWAAVFVVLGSALVVFRSSLETHPRLAAALACLVTGASVWVASRAVPDRPLSLGAAFGAILGLFHVGLLVPLAVGAPLHLLHPWDDLWVRSPSFSAAALTIAIALCAYSAGYLTWVSVRQRPTRRQAAQPTPAQPVAVDPALGPDAGRLLDGPGVVGSLMLLGGVLLWFYNTTRSGVPIIGSSYAGFLSATAATPMPRAYLLMGFGIGVVAASSSRRARRLMLAVFAAFALPGFMLGLRGEVILPALAYLVVAARVRHLPLRPWMAVVPVAALAAGSAVRVIRQLGLGNADAGLGAVSPLDGLTELGYSIRPLALVHQYHDRLGEPFVGMETYLAPVRRLVVGRLLGGEALPVAQDPSVLSTIVLQRVGPIGGSPVAEAYRSMGTTGVVVVMVLIGLLVAHLDTMHSSRLADSAAGMASFILLLWVRNDFTPVLAEVAAATAVIVLVWFFEQRRAKTASGRPAVARDRR